MCAWLIHTCNLSFKTDHRVIIIAVPAPALAPPVPPVPPVPVPPVPAAIIRSSHRPSQPNNQLNDQYATAVAVRSDYLL